MRKILIIILLVVIGGGTVWFILKDLQSPIEQSEIDASEDIIDLVPEVQPPVVNTIPDLNRPIIVSTDLSPASEKEFTDSIKKVSEQLKNNPDVFDGWLILGLYRKEIGDFEGAREAWEYLTTIYPKDYRAFKNIAVLYSYQHELNDFSKTEEWYKRGIEANPDATQLYSALAEFYQYFTKEIEKADDILLLGLKNNPGNLNIISQLAYFYKNIGENKKAINYFEQLVVLDSSNNKARQELENLKNN